MCAMVVGSGLAIAKQRTEIAVGCLFATVIVQTFGYGLLFNASVLFRNFSITGGLLILLADAFMTNKKKNFVFAGLPNINENDKTMYLQLFGRILLVGLLFSFIMNGELGFIRVCVIIISFFSCIMVVIGFKAKYSAWVLITFMSIGNVILNNWWSLHQ